MIDNESLMRMQSQLAGSQCTNVDKQEGYLLVSFGTMQIMLQSSWRQVEGGQILVGSGSIDSVSSSSLIGRTVQSISIVNDFNDFRMMFVDGSVLESFADAGEFENWTFHINEAEMIIAGPGTLWSSFSTSETSKAFSDRFPF